MVVWTLWPSIEPPAGLHSVVRMCVAVVTSASGVGHTKSSHDKGSSGDEAEQNRREIHHENNFLGFRVVSPTTRDETVALVGSPRGRARGAGFAGKPVFACVLTIAAAPHRLHPSTEG